MFQAQFPNVVFAIQTSIFIKDHALNHVPIVLQHIDSKRYACQSQKVTAWAKELRVPIGFSQKHSPTKIHKDIFTYYQPIFKMRIIWMIHWVPYSSFSEVMRFKTRANLWILQPPSKNASFASRVSGLMPMVIAKNAISLALVVHIHQTGNLFALSVTPIIDWTTKISV